MDEKQAITSESSSKKGREQMSRKFKIIDATKDELIQYFFHSETMGGGFEIPADKVAFLIWLRKKRYDELFSEYKTATGAAHAAMGEYFAYAGQANAECDLDKRKILWNKAHAALQQSARFRKKSEELYGKIEDMLEDQDADI